MSRRLQIIAAFAMVYAVWGSSFVAIRYAAPLVNPALVSGIRYGIAALILFAWVGAQKHSIRLPLRELLQVSALGILMFSLNPTLVTYGARVLSAGTVALFLATIPLFVSVLEACMPAGYSMAPAGWVGICAGFGGLTLLVWHNVNRASPPAVAGFACACLLLASFSWALGSVMCKRMALRSSVLVLAAWQMLIGGCVDVIAAIMANGISTSHLNARIWGAMLYLAIIGSVACYTCYLFLLRTVSIYSAATYAYINPIVAVVLGWIILGERPQRLEWIGTAVIVVSVAMVIRSNSTSTRQILSHPGQYAPESGSA